MSENIMINLKAGVIALVVVVVVIGGVLYGLDFMGLVAPHNRTAQCIERIDTLDTGWERLISGWKDRIDSCAVDTVGKREWEQYQDIYAHLLDGGHPRWTYGYLVDLIPNPADPTLRLRVYRRDYISRYRDTTYTRRQPLSIDTTWGDCYKILWEGK